MWQRLERICFHCLAFLHTSSIFWFLSELWSVSQVVYLHSRSPLPPPSDRITVLGSRQASKVVVVQWDTKHFISTIHPHHSVQKRFTWFQRITKTPGVTWSQITFLFSHTSLKNNSRNVFCESLWFNRFHQVFSFPVVFDRPPTSHISSLVFKETRSWNDKCYLSQTQRFVNQFQLFLSEKWSRVFSHNDRVAGWSIKYLWIFIVKTTKKWKDWLFNSLLCLSCAYAFKFSISSLNKYLSGKPLLLDLNLPCYNCIVTMKKALFGPFVSQKDWMNKRVCET